MEAVIAEGGRGEARRREPSDLRALRQMDVGVIDWMILCHHYLCLLAARVGSG